jgi:RNA polymerase-interacting CarD/CdnL/TRCF family regulator
MTMIKTTPTVLNTQNTDVPKALADNAGLKNALSRKMMEQILKKLEEDTKVKIYSNLLQE